IHVFISYSHDSPEHEQQVLALSERLRKDGIDAQVDQYINGTPPEGWPRWMLNELDKAEFVLLVCTETYYRRFRGHEQPGKGKGADWEGALITQEIYDARSRTLKFVPILFDPGDEQYIPEPLRLATRYTVNSEAAYEGLYDFLLGQAGVEPGDLGNVRRKERKRGEPLTFAAETAAGAQESTDPRARVAASVLPRKVAPTRLRHSAEKLIGRETDLARLDEAWADPATHVLTIVAFGGVGKTSLVAHWAAGLAQRGYDGADYFDWSFYSQGTREQGGASADQFINRALEFFGDPEMGAGAASPWDKGARLAQLVAERRALLVLDGLEPLQYPPGALAGELRDPAIAALLKGLAQRNPGLCVVTTRERVSDLASFRASTAPELPLHHLSTPAGVELLHTLGVQGSEKEFQALVEEVQGHALTLNLLGRYLVRAHDGDIRKRDQVRFEKADDSVQGGHAFKAMAAYERWLAPPEPRKLWWWPFSRQRHPGNQAGARQLAILRLIGLFDRPADVACLEALRRSPAIAGLTEPIVNLPEEDWNLAVAALADCGLVSVPEGTDSGAIDAHPLIREYFAKRLRDQSPEAWREAHSRLYEHLRDSVEYQPDTLDGLQPLYQAVAHGCHAGLHQEASRTVYWDRILRGAKFYSIARLGAVGADLGAVACFFDHPWTKISPLLTVQEQSWLMAEAATRLQALGRLSEALQPMRAGLTMDIDEQDWENAAINADNLCRLELTLGDVDSAVMDAEQAQVRADRNGDWSEHMITRTALAEALHQAGHGDEARALFHETEEMQAGNQPQYPLLYSLRGFHYCNLLLSRPESTAWRSVIRCRKPAGGQVVEADGEPATCREVETRAGQILRWAQDKKLSILDIAIGHLSLGRALLYRSVVELDASVTALGTEPQTHLALAQSHIDAAVDGLHRAGHSDFLPHGLLSRAWLRFLQGDDEGARADLDEAWEIAERGPMRLFLADIHLYRARLFHAVQPYPWDSPHADLAAARKLIEECGYWRRKEELEDAEAASENW
ncbi:MAG TPA: SEFIR domain-containing protein, partial [Longimicrobium sp.]|nr:SEFIR domain-containing protein [Longimicrobium sp.]